MFSLLGALPTSWKEIGATVEWASGWIGDLLDVLSQVLWVGMAIAGAAGSIYAIWIGIKMAKAETTEEREEAKKHLINVIIAVVCLIALIVVFNVLVPVIIGAIAGQADIGLVDSGSSGQAINSLVNTMKCLMA